MRPIVTDGVAWVVCWSVCLSRSWALGWSDEDAIWDMDSGWPKEPCVGPDPHTWMGSFEGERDPAQDMPGRVRCSICSAGGSTGTVRMPIGVC